LLDDGTWQCSGCHEVYLEPWRATCPNCGRIDYWSGSVHPDALEAARRKRDAGTGPALPVGEGGHMANQIDLINGASVTVFVGGEHQGTGYAPAGERLMGLEVTVGNNQGRTRLTLSESDKLVELIRAFWGARL
jgi:hypothetical protein